MPLYTDLPTIKGLAKMKYVSGVNFKSPNLPEVELPSNYSNLNIHSNFFSNVNIMLIFIPISLIVSGFLFTLSLYNKSYKHKPRLRKYAFACLLEWPLTLFLFSFYNIYSSLVIDITYLGSASRVS